MADHLLPGLTEHIAANVVHSARIEHGAPAPPTTGSLYRPVPEGTEVDGGTRDRMKAEDRHEQRP